MTDFVDAIINLNKPEGMTSFQCVSAVRRILGIKKVGHAGTLDPEASGVLPLSLIHISEPTRRS